MPVLQAGSGAAEAAAGAVYCASRCSSVRDVLEQPGAGETEKVEAESRILHVELLDLGIADAQDQTRLRCIPASGFAHSTATACPVSPTMAPDRQFDAGFDQPEPAADDVEHLLGLLVLVEQHFAGRAFALGHERLQPLHRQVAVDRFLHVAHQLQHLVQPIGIERQQHPVQQQRRIIAQRNRRCDQQDIGEDGEYPQRDHGPHRERRHHEDRGEKAAGGAGVFCEM